MKLPRLAAALLALTLPAMAADPTPKSAAAPAPAAAKPKIGSTVWDWDKLVVLPRANGQRRDIADNPTANLATFECHITTLNVGQSSHAPHTHPQEELIFIKEGKVEAHLNGQTTVVGPGSIFFFATNDAHSARNVGDTPATYWVVNLATPATRDAALRNKEPKVKSAVFDYEKLEVRPSRVGEGRRVLDGSTVTLANLETHITTINAGEAPHAPHAHPDEEVVLVRQGVLEVTINGKTERAGPGSVILVGSNDLHGWKNVSNERAIYHVVRIVTAETPKPAAAVK
jgi:quercetin dioxygenase-like cupin family protein